MCNNTQDPDLPGRIGDRGYHALSASSAAASAAASADGDLSERNDGPGRHNLSSSAASASAAASGAQIRRARLISWAGAQRAPAYHPEASDSPAIRSHVVIHGY